jgi:hypothetical protein
LRRRAFTAKHQPVSLARLVPVCCEAFSRVLKLICA